MLDLYKNIKRRRIELGWTQDELARKMSYTDRSTIAKIESGKSDLPHSKIEQFADVLGVTASFLMGWTDGEVERPIEEVREQAMLNGYRKLDEADQRNINRMITAMLEDDKYKKQTDKGGKVG